MGEYVSPERFTFTLANDILERYKIRSSALYHGIINDENPVNQYKQITKYQCQASGLIVHRDLPYLAASPDGLIGDGGVLEIKCPYKFRDLHPDNVNLDYIDSNNNLKTNHNYYYQVQGVLEIADSGWCNVVIFTYKGISIQRIRQDKEFWGSIEGKLKSFYLYFFSYYSKNCHTKNNIYWSFKTRRITTINESMFILF